MGITNVALNVFRSRTVDVCSKKCFSFAKKHNIFDASGSFNTEGLALVHLTDFAPTEGVIKTTRDAIGWIRNSVHFTVNHSVVSHWGGDWSAKKYAIIMPFEQTVKHKGNKIIGGVPTDLYSIGSIKIPKGTVIVRYNESIPKGKYKIVDASKIQELKKLKGIKVIESSDKNIQEVTDDVITKLGYEAKSTSNPFVWGMNSGDNNGYGMLDKFNKFLKRHNMQPMFHTYTPNGRIESVCENLGFRAGHANSWIVKNKNGDVILDYKDMYIKILKDIEWQTKADKYQLESDISKLIEIINLSKTPKEAEQAILKSFNLNRHSLIVQSQGVINEYTIYQDLVVKSDFDKDFLLMLEEYLQKPNAELYMQLITSAQKNQLRCIATKHLCDLGADESVINSAKSANNEIANQLYQLI